MLYREAGQFKTSYAADMAIFPIRQDRIALVAAAGLRLHRRAAARRLPHLAVRQRLSAARHPHPVPDPVAGRHRPEHPDRLLRPDLARQRRLHGDRRLHRLQVRHRRAHSARLARHRHLDSAAAGAALDPARRPDGGVRRHPVRHPEPAHQGSLSRGGDAGRAVLLRLGVHPREVVHQLHAVRLGERAGAQLLRLRRQHADRALSAVPRLRDGVRAASPRTWCAATSAGSGWRSATWTSPPS